MQMNLRGVGDAPDFGGTITAGGALPCCSGVQLGSGYANLPSGDIRYRISDYGDLCDPNCLGVPSGGTPAGGIPSGGGIPIGVPTGGVVVPNSSSSSMMLLLAGLGLVILLVASR